jgi:regulator of protease activity HflC (stomatin/prohibitin superfamily)
MEALVGIALLIIVAVICFWTLSGRVTVFEYEKGLKYSKGQFDQIIGPGQYWYIPFSSSIQKIDIRPRFVSITGQEVLSSDTITLKVSLAAKY